MAIGSSSRLGIGTVPFFYLRVTSLQDHSWHGKIPSVRGRHAAVLLHLHIRVCIWSYSIQDCVRDVSDWFLTNCMQLNGDKSEAMLFALGAQAAKVDPKCNRRLSQVRLWNYPPTSGASAFTWTVNSIWIGMSNSVCSSCYYHIRALRHIRPSLNQETAANIGRSVVSSRLDYCNSLMYGIVQGEHEEAPTSAKCVNSRHLFIGATWLCIRSPTGSALAPDRTADHFQDRCTHIQLSPEVGSSVSVWSSSWLSATSNVEIRWWGDPWGAKN